VITVLNTAQTCSGGRPLRGKAVGRGTALEHHHVSSLSLLKSFRIAATSVQNPSLAETKRGFAIHSEE